VNSDIYERDRVFAEDEAKAYSTCEAVLLDVKTGILPFTTIVTREHWTKKTQQDMNLLETLQRVEQAATLKSVHDMSVQTLAFLRELP
jgi:hypothetical protein